MGNHFNWKNLIEVLFITIVLISFLFSIINYSHDTDDSFTEEKITGAESGSESNFASILQKSEKSKSTVPPPSIPV